MKTPLFAAAALATLAACAPPPPVVQAFNGDSVTVQTFGVRVATTDAEALRICSSAGRARAEFLSSKATENPYLTDHLYACLG